MADAEDLEIWKFGNFGNLEIPEIWKSGSPEIRESGNLGIGETTGFRISEWMG
jgi:hypothetical protein